MPGWLSTFLRGPLGQPRRPVARPPLTADAHGNIWDGNVAISGPAATSYTAGAQGATGGHPAAPSGTFQHKPYSSIGP